MSDDLLDLYQEVILDHSRSPRNFGPLEGANRTAEGYNPLCGDKIKVFAQVEEGVIREIGFEGQGCAISQASASMMTERLTGKTLKEAEELFQGFHQLLTGEELPGAESEGPELGKLEVFSGVKEFPIRVKCATLPWHALYAALKEDQEPVSTE